MNLQELAIVNNRRDNLIHVVGHVGIVGDKFVEGILFAVNRVCTFLHWSFLHIVLRNILEQFANQSRKFFFCLSCEMSHTANTAVHTSATQIFLTYVLTRHCLYHFRTSKEHITNAFQHHNKVGQSGTIYSTTSTRTADTRNLRNHTARFNIALENLTKARQRVDTFLDARTA